GRKDRRASTAMLQRAYFFSDSQWNLEAARRDRCPARRRAPAPREIIASCRRPAALRKLQKLYHCAAASKLPRIRPVRAFLSARAGQIWRSLTDSDALFHTVQSRAQ